MATYEYENDVLSTRKNFDVIVRFSDGKIINFESRAKVDRIMCYVPFIAYAIKTKADVAFYGMQKRIEMWIAANPNKMLVAAPSVKDIANLTVDEITLAINSITDYNANTN